MRQPNSKNCFVCGMQNPVGLHLRFDSETAGEVTATFTAPEHFQGYPGVVHGGIVAAMLDEITGRAHMGSNPPRFMYTARLEIRYRKNVPVGQPLKLIGKAVKSKGRTATSVGEIYGSDGSLLAEAVALLIDLPPDTFGNVDLEQLGWKVYPDTDLPHEND